MLILQSKVFERICLHVPRGLRGRVRVSTSSAHLRRSWAAAFRAEACILHKSIATSADLGVSWPRMRLDSWSSWRRSRSTRSIHSTEALSVEFLQLLLRSLCSHCQPSLLL